MIELLEIMKALISGNTSTYSVKLLQRRLGEITLNFYISFTRNYIKFCKATNLCWYWVISVLRNFEPAVCARLFVIHKVMYEWQMSTNQEDIFNKISTDLYWPFQRIFLKIYFLKILLESNTRKNYWTVDAFQCWKMITSCSKLWLFVSRNWSFYPNLRMPSPCVCNNIK